MKFPSGEIFQRVNQKLRKYRLNTVCTAARCPNLAECWSRGTATFMILGDTCTRHCRFCSVPPGNPRGKIDEDEPERVASAVRELGLKYIVLTSVDRDDLEDSGAANFVRTIKAIKTIPDVRVEVLTPDFGGRAELIGQVLEAGPDVFAHNIETTKRVSPHVRDPRASYQRSLKVLSIAKRKSPDTFTKSSIMVGLGETDEEILQTMEDLRSVGCDILTIGQYLQPARRCIPVSRYVEPVQFQLWEQQALKMGFCRALCGPLVRSSYRADQVFPG